MLVDRAGFEPARLADPIYNRTVSASHPPVQSVLRTPILCKDHLSSDVIRAVRALSAGVASPSLADTCGVATSALCRRSPVMFHNLRLDATESNRLDIGQCTVA